MRMLDSFNPVARLAGALVVTTPLLISVDLVSATVALVLCTAVALAWGFRFTRLLPLCAIAPLAGVSMALYARPEGHEYFSFGFAHITDNSLALAAAIMVRVIAVALPVLVLTDRLDPTDLGDGLAQVAHLPERFVVASVAGVRMLTLFRDDWASLNRARRARGIADQGRLRHTLTLSFGLLVAALRRGSTLAVAMEARGFGSGPRTWARRSQLHRRDAALIAGCAVVAAISIAAAVWTGQFRFLGA